MGGCQPDFCLKLHPRHSSYPFISPASDLMGNSHQSRFSPGFHIPYGTLQASQETSAGTNFGSIRMPTVKYQKGDKVMGRWPGSSLYYEVKVLRFDTKSQLYTVIYKDGTELELKEQDIKCCWFPGPFTLPLPLSFSITRPPSQPVTLPSKDLTAILLPHSGGCRCCNYNRQCTVLPQGYKAEGCARSQAQSPDAKAVEAKPEQLEEKKVKLVAAPAAALSTPLDFGGKIGAYFWLLFLPVCVLLLILQVKQDDPSLTNFPPPLPPLEAFWDAQALGCVIVWILFQALLYILPVGKLSEGMPLRSGGKLKYRTNGFFAISVSAVAVAAAVYQGVDLTYIHSNFLQLAAATFLISVLLSIYLYVRSRYAAPDQLALGGNSGNVIYDFFKGHELNPRIKDFDLKFFCEMRPGLIGWCLINFAMALAEMKQQQLDAPSHAMILVNLFQLLYVVDGLWNEEAILTTIDLMHDGFGFMLAFGDLVWVPFTYTLQAYYLVNHPNPLSPLALSVIVSLKLIGFYIFRKSNSEKNAFRRNPSDPKLSHLKTIPTATGKSLLVSGWWGVVRHPNYLGDLIMALAWSLPCGFSHLLPWYYMIYFIILLVHRDSRDMNECRRKYGSAWDEYCRTVRYRIIPRVY
eukprot:superscaffoldBa00001528_g10965